MNLADQLSENLDAWQPVSEGPMLHTVSLPGWTVHLQADRADRVGCQLSEFSLVRNAPSPDGLTMTSWAEGIARRVTGLLEPLKLLEADPDRKQALLRSTAPGFASPQVLRSSPATAGRPGWGVRTGISGVGWPRHSLSR
jgi:hypothetical protein